MNVDELNVITLAYMGDAIYEVYIRAFLIKKGIYKVNDLQKEAVKYVSAKSQTKLLNTLINNNILNSNELEIIKRGRNYKRCSHPRNTDVVTYKLSTGFEALFGYLYLNNNISRIEEILSEVYDANIWEEC